MSLANRTQALREGLLLVLVNAPNDYSRAAAMWREFKKRVGKEAEDPAELHAVLKSVWHSREFQIFDRERRKWYEKSDKYKAKKQAYDAARYLKRKEAKNAQAHTPAD